MKTYKLITFLFIFIVSNCYSQKRESFTLQLFKNLENIKCYDGAIDQHLMESGYFESVGRKSNYRGYYTFSNLKDYIGIKSFDDAIGYYMEASSPDAYNFIKKNGIYKGTATDLYYKTNFVYFYNGTEFNIRKMEVPSAGFAYVIWSICDK